MKQVNIYEAKTQLSKLLEMVEHGEDVVIARAGRPVARLVRPEPVGTRRTLGVLDGRIRVPDDFNRPLPADILDGFEGKD